MATPGCSVPHPEYVASLVGGPRWWRFAPGVSRRSGVNQVVAFRTLVPSVPGRRAGFKQSDVYQVVAFRTLVPLVPGWWAGIHIAFLLNSWFLVRCPGGGASHPGCSNSVQLHCILLVCLMAWPVSAAPAGGWVCCVPLAQARPSLLALRAFSVGHSLFGGTLPPYSFVEFP